MLHCKPPGKAAFTFYNFFGYENVHPVPANLPGDLTTIYVTDSEENKQAALRLGWQRAYAVDRTPVNNLRERFDVVGVYSCYPEKVVPELCEFDRIFVTDSNVATLDSKYGDFVGRCNNNYALYVTSGYYVSNRDTIMAELAASCQERWLFSWEAMQQRTQEYCEMLCDKPQPRVVSNKYRGWNIRHPMRTKVADWVYGEFKIHIQGNIIHSVASVLFEDCVLNYEGFANDGTLYPHVGYR